MKRLLSAVRSSLGLASRAVPPAAAVPIKSQAPLRQTLSSVSKASASNDQAALKSAMERLTAASKDSNPRQALDVTAATQTEGKSPDVLYALAGTFYAAQQKPQAAALWKVSMHITVICRASFGHLLTLKVAIYVALHCAHNRRLQMLVTLWQCITMQTV
jgi:hypothetical protein